MLDAVRLTQDRITQTGLSDVGYSQINPGQNSTERRQRRASERLI